MPGYVIEWQKERNTDGLPVTDIEPVSDARAKEEITQAIQFKEGPNPVEFWP